MVVMSRAWYTSFLAVRGFSRWSYYSRRIDESAFSRGICENVET